MRTPSNVLEAKQNTMPFHKRAYSYQNQSTFTANTVME